MSEHFKVASVHGGVHLEFLGAIRRDLGEGDSCTYRARLTGGPVEASVEVYDMFPEAWAKLFEDMARQWRGWDGALQHASLEGHISVSCTSNRTGHIKVRVKLNGEPSGADWLAANTLYLEAGQLDELARQARDYFG
jgi:hypothetical protein